MDLCDCEACRSFVRTSAVHLHLSPVSFGPSPVTGQVVGEHCRRACGPGEGEHGEPLMKDRLTRGWQEEKNFLLKAEKLIFKNLKSKFGA